MFALAPFGHGNPAPLFAALNVEVAAPPAVWKEKHLKVMVRQNGRTLVLEGLELRGARRRTGAGHARGRGVPARRGRVLGGARYPGWSGTLRDFRPAE